MPWKRKRNREVLSLRFKLEKIVLMLHRLLKVIQVIIKDLTQNHL